MRINMIRKEDWGLSIPPGTPISEVIEALQTLPKDLVVQGDYTRLSQRTVITFDRAEADDASSGPA